MMTANLNVDDSSLKEQAIGAGLPEGWETVALQELVSRKKGKKPKKLGEHKWQGSVPYIDIEAFETRDIRRYADPDTSVLVDKGDVVVVWDGARCGHVGKVPVHGALGSTLMNIKPIMINPDYLLRFLQLSYETVNSNPRGTGIPHVEPQLFWNLELPLAPLSEQKRIVAKVEELLARVNAVRERLAKVKELLKRFRQSVLSAACSGRLTDDWRTTHSRNVSAYELLEAIMSMRQERLRENGVQLHKTPFKPDTSQLRDLPPEWAVTSMDQVTCLITSGSRGWAKFYSRSGPLFIRAQNINMDSLRLEDVAHLQPPQNAEGRRTRIRFGDLLITITGANVTKSALVDTEIDEAYISQHVALVRPVDISLRHFLYFWTISPFHGRAKLIKDAYGAGKPGLNLKNIREMTLALPPLAEQEEIIRRVGALFKLADRIEKRVAAAGERAEGLTEAILAKAFRGELVPTEAELARREGRSYKSASALLAKIKTQRS
jgi:type I restriction enzyme S subunit